MWRGRIQDGEHPDRDSLRHALLEVSLPCTRHARDVSDRLVLFKAASMLEATMLQAPHNGYTVGSGEGLGRWMSSWGSGCSQGLCSGLATSMALLCDLSPHVASWAIECMTRECVGSNAFHYAAQAAGDGVPGQVAGRRAA